MNLNRLFNSLLFFKEPKEKKEFFLPENEPKEDRAYDKKSLKYCLETDGRKEQGEKAKRPLTVDEWNKVKEVKGGEEDSKEDKESKEKDEDKDEDKDKDEQACKSNGMKDMQLVSRSLKDNLAFLKKVYSIPTNGDIMIREFDISIGERYHEAFIIFIDGLTDRNVINQNILQPLMLLSNLENKTEGNDLIKYIERNILPENQIKKEKEFEKIIGDVNFGSCALFVNGVNQSIVCDVKGWEHRGVDRPNTEIVIRGPQEGFGEILRINTALVRKLLKDEDLIAENISLGERSKTPCSIMYIKDIANEALVEEVRRRIKSIKVDYIYDSGILEQLIEDNSVLPAPQIIATERPDRVASMLAEGKVAIMVNGNPFVLVLPATFVGFLHSPEDSYIRFPYANLLRAIRFLGIFMTLLLPGIYVAVTNYHPELLPTDLLFAIAGAREKVPFPGVVEILIMEVSFELIREAGIRIPGAVGTTLGIIGALILGQAAVEASIVSPILIIIVAVTGIGSFAVPSFSLAFAFRILRFGYIILAALSGFLGLALGLFIHGLVTVHAKSFGVPFLAPFAPKTSKALRDAILRTPEWMQEQRPDYVSPQDDKRQPDISRRWKFSSDDKEDN